MFKYHLMGLREHLCITCQWGLCSLTGSELGVSGWELPEATVPGLGAQVEDSVTILSAHLQ